MGETQGNTHPKAKSLCTSATLKLISYTPRKYNNGTGISEGKNRPKERVTFQICEILGKKKHFKILS